jgi:hypothetical protein
MKLVRTILVAATGFAVLSVDVGSLTQGEISVTSAHAVRGRPATPVSYAGVARRTTRRTVAAVAATTTTCVQTVDVYGRVVTRCR